MTYWRYWMLLAGQLSGAVIILWNAVPAYRSLLLDRSSEPTSSSVLQVSLGAAMLLVCWQLRYRKVPLPVLPQRWLLGHLILFIARFSMILPGGLFSVIVFLRFEQISFSSPNMALLFGMLFALFCFTTELERLGRRLTTTE